MKFFASLLSAAAVAITPDRGCAGNQDRGHYQSEAALKLRCRCASAATRFPDIRLRFRMCIACQRSVARVSRTSKRRSRRTGRGQRNHPSMMAVAKGLTDQQISAVAAYYAAAAMSGCSGREMTGGIRMRYSLLSAALLVARAGRTGRQEGRRAGAAAVRRLPWQGFRDAVDPTYPKLAGQYQDYLEKALRDYKTGARKNPIMNGIAKPLTRDDIRDLPAYLSVLPGPRSTSLARVTAVSFVRRGASDSRNSAASSRRPVCLPRALRAPYHFTEAFHYIVHRCVFVIALRDESLEYSADAGGLIYRNCSAIARCIDMCKNGLVRPSSTAYSAQAGVRTSNSA